MKIKISPDIQKAEALKKMAMITIERLEETHKEKYPSNTLTDYYDVLHKLMEAISLKEGTKIKGEGAHQQLIDYLSHNEYLVEQERIFLQEMREYRNRISYEGYMVNKNYISINKNLIEKTIQKLITILEKK